jgi:hypothetical protein
MMIRQSSLTQFGDSLTRFMNEAGSHDEDVKFSLDYMHSVYKKKKVLTLISPDNGAIALLTHDSPDLPFGLLVTASNIVPGDSRCWEVPIYDLGVKQKQKFAQWLIDIFKAVSYLDTDIQFMEKMNVLIKDALEQGLAFVSQGTFCQFEHKEYDI